MKLFSKCKKILQSSILVAGVAATGNVSAGLINSDFTDGLDGWGGDVAYYDLINNIDNDAFDVDFGDYPANFSTGINSVTLNTSADNDNEYWGVYLFQSFMVDPNSSLLSLSFQSSADYAYLTLVDENFNLLHDFINDGLSVDISTYTGTNVSLEMGIEDWDFVLDDYLTVSNISISQNSVPVPEPSTFLLFSIALLAVRQWSNKVNLTTQH
ncbi:PEP-CTERM sorting domain-containing protein [Catenovulum sediminis]|uniref:PEP-CTERM sorting domain-containing protein n=1 Tax=Catenovulum sediminis TaxID=1740262 RepID=A0ABV1RCX2_9ALTE